VLLAQLGRLSGFDGAEMGEEIDVGSGLNDVVQRRSHLSHRALDHELGRDGLRRRVLGGMGG
jgi:hypothetical protein